MDLRTRAASAPAAVRVRLRRVGRLVSGDRRAFLFTLFGSDTVGAEIGVWRGDFSARLLQRVRPKTLHLVDPWTYVDDDAYDAALYGGAEAGSQGDMDAIARAVADRFAPQIGRGQVVVHRAPSLAAARQVDDGSLDWAYVDGDHSYDAVLADLRAWWPKLAPGGLMAGDDYDDGGWWGDSVARAVATFNGGQPGAHLLCVAHNQFVFRKE